MNSPLKFEVMKLELLVIGDQHALVNGLASAYTPPVTFLE